ncbi:hypothetical protein RB195_022516 [Necator americanus]|uniref:Integrase catalytic domain-containing protein n=1 Tax=Necator americanus TaxID=51031 RepID=A0ABR1EFU1_NECAM
MSSSSTTATLRELRMLFARFGNPRVIVSDNGTQFTAKEFQEFCDMQGIEHVGGVSEELAEFLQWYRRTPCAPTPGHLSPAEVFLGRQLRTSLTLLKESAKEGTRSVEIEEQFNRHHGAQKRSYHQEELVWARDYRPGHEKWTSARVKNRYGRAVYDVLTEEDDLWKRHDGNQMRGEKHRRISCEKTKASKMPFNQDERRYHGMARTIADVNNNVKDRAPTIMPPTTTRPARQRRPPRRLQPDPKMKTYAMRSS